ncbi:unnamed protein product [Amaranthus hypochondriacus]
MAIVFPLKALLLSASVVSMAVILKVSAPVILDFLSDELPLFWSLALSWLQPPFLYLLVNCIIITIVASSKLQPRDAGHGVLKTPAMEKNLTPVNVPVVERVDSLLDVIDVNKEEDLVVFGYVDSPLVVKDDTAVRPSKIELIGGEFKAEEDSENSGDGEEFLTSKSPKKIAPVVLEYSPLSSAEKPPISARFSNRRSIKASPEGKAALGVSRLKKHETLESTWRTITEGRSMPLKRHLRKSETFAGSSPEKSPVRAMKKSETVDGGNSSPVMSGSRKLRKEPSLSQDELNRRVEAFIKKFNEEMRLQRQESLNQYREMINGRGSQ